MARRPDVLDHTVLGVLADGPLHGYELRKRLTAILGPFRALSYGSLYPCLHRLSERGLIDPREEPGASRRARITYALTSEGKEAFAAWVDQVGPEAWEDEGFAARLAFFSVTDAAVRMRILEGRRTRLEERLRILQESLDRTDARLDAYAERLRDHGIDGTRREVSWIEELIEAERGARRARKQLRQARRTAKKSARRPVD